MLEIEVSGIQQTITRLNRVISSLTNEKEFFEKEAVPILEDESKAIFDTEGFGTWPPLSPAYAAFKLRTVGEKTILRYSDDYFLSLTQQTHGGATRLIKGNTLTFGVNLDYFIGKSGVPYPIYHEAKNSRPPHRPVIAFLTEKRVSTRLAKAYSDYVVRAVS